MKRRWRIQPWSDDNNEALDVPRGSIFDRRFFTRRGALRFARRHLRHGVVYDASTIDDSSEVSW